VIGLKLNISKKNNFLFFNFKKYRDSRAIITEKKTFYYKDLDEISDKFLLKLKNEKKLVFLLGENNYETIIGYIGFFKKGYVIAIIDNKIHKSLLNNLIKNYKPHYIFCQKSSEKIKSYKSIYNFYSYQLLERTKNLDIKVNENLFLLMSTSGSTGSPKLVRLSYQNVFSNTVSISKYLKIKKKDITITSLPFSYVYGLSVINTHLHNGSTIVLTNKTMTEKKFWGLIDQYKVTNLAGVPYHYLLIERFFKSFVPKSIKYTTQAGGKMNNILIKNLLTIYKKHNIKLIQMYGATEATSRMSYLNHKFAQKKIGSIGQAIPGGKFEIRNKDGKIINTVRKKGELIYRGKNVFMGYATCINDLALSDINKGILYTGDIAYKDKDDFYYIIGRKDRYVKIYGIRVNLSELENILYKKGIDTNMKELKDNKIEVYFKKLNNIDNIISYLCKKTNLKKNVFITKKLTKKNFNKNLKIKI